MEKPSEQVKINRRRVESSAIESVGYSSEYRMLDVEFTHGQVYRYLNVPPGEYELMLASDSIGRYFNSFIKGQYEQENGHVQTDPNIP